MLYDIHGLICQSFQPTRLSYFNHRIQIIDLTHARAGLAFNARSFQKLLSFDRKTLNESSIETDPVSQLNNSAIKKNKGLLRIHEEE